MPALPSGGVYVASTIERQVIVWPLAFTDTGLSLNSSAAQRSKIVPPRSASVSRG